MNICCVLRSFVWKIFLRGKVYVNCERKSAKTRQRKNPRSGWSLVCKKGGRVSGTEWHFSKECITFAWLIQENIDSAFASPLLEKKSKIKHKESEVVRLRKGRENYPNKHTTKKIRLMYKWNSIAHSCFFERFIYSHDRSTYFAK
jgi:hypothetical protein